MNPLEVAQLLARVGTSVRREDSGLYVIDATVPPTFLTLWEYEAGRKVLDLREKAQTLR